MGNLPPFPPALIVRTWAGVSHTESLGVCIKSSRSREGFHQPDILIVQNCGFAEFPDNGKSESWIQGWAFGLGSLVLAFTSYSRKEAEEFFDRFMKYCAVLPTGLPYRDKVCRQTILKRPFIKCLPMVCHRLLESAKREVEFENWKN